MVIGKRDADTGIGDSGGTRHAARSRPGYLVCCAMIFLMVVIGGITRLTLSGLSITEWQPVTGIVPPLSGADWATEFAKYQQIPQYKLLNSGMSLAEFKTIYLWEYTHRLWGRLIGFVYLVPFLYFLVAPPDSAPVWLGRSPASSPSVQPKACSAGTWSKAASPHRDRGQPIPPDRPPRPRLGDLRRDAVDRAGALDSAPAGRAAAASVHGSAPRRRSARCSSSP